MGQHTFKFGGSFHLDHINTDPDTASNGSFAFRGTETGLDFADFLLGIASSYAQVDSKSFYPRNEYIYWPVRARYLADLAQLDVELWTAMGFAAGLARKIQPLPGTGAGRAVRGFSGGAERTGVPGRSRGAVDIGANEVHEFCAAVGTSVRTQIS